ncbi:acyl-CoA-binding domain-containing protein 6-like [Actinia tenebrosa]|uniref:Acyl-CoA-binding domain-containing protein 6 n=1 Tax=Actinia tenebrosa TaxID=6105 RepID=A0A6P8I758_ACTTE|nr:acyl-CoA-binding domain-containing protein 6-like [Actinia tenebrosa]
MADDVDVNVDSREDVEQMFTEATEYVKILQGLSDEDKLLFYGLYKQAKEGPVKTSRPAFWDFVGRAKWDAWKSLDKLDKETAMDSYIQKLYCLDPDWDIKYLTCSKDAISASSNAPKQQTMGLAVSTLRRGWCDEFISDVNKSVFDWCKEGNVKRLDHLLSKGQDIDQKDDQGMALLHWACDRGHDHVVDYLIKNKADVNIRDAEGQTPLHYAATCEFLSIVKQLLDAKADQTIQDDDGCLAENATDNKEIINILLRRE